MKPNTYPNLRKLWLRRAWRAKWRALGGALLGLSLLTVLVTSGSGVQGRALAYVFMGIAFGIYCAVKLVLIIAGLIKFEHLWYAQLREQLQDEDLRSRLSEVDLEIGGRLRQFRDVAFTENYTIFFREIKDVVKTDSIRSLHFENNIEQHIRGSLRTYQHLYCSAHELGHMHLSYQFHEMAEIVGEILHHNPDVWRDDNVRDTFYVVEPEEAEISKPE